MQTAFRSIARSALSSGAFLLGQASRWRESAAPPWRILMYHRVVDPRTIDYPIEPGMYVRPQTFERHCSYLAKNCHVLPLKTLSDRILAGEPIESGTVAITFDDGWRDNFDFALPVLRQYELSATIFLATAFIGTFDTFWTDKVAIWMAAFHKSGLAPERKELPSLSESLWTELRTLLSRKFGTAHNRETLAAFVGKLKLLDKAKRSEFLSELERLAERCPHFPRLSRAFLNWDEVRLMNKAGLDFASHTHSHILASDLSSHDFSEDISHSLTQMKDEGISPSSVFCFPGGVSTLETRDAVAQLGFRSALASSFANDFSGNLKLLGRVGVHQDICHSIPLFCSRVWGPFCV